MIGRVGRERETENKRNQRKEKEMKEIHKTRMKKRVWYGIQGKEIKWMNEKVEKRN